MSDLSLFNLISTLRIHKQLPSKSRFSDIACKSRKRNEINVKLNQFDKKKLFLKVKNDWKNNKNITLCHSHNIQVCFIRNYCSFVF